jgi:glycosyltransferase involved in cell wall biosynthesis
MTPTVSVLIPTRNRAGLLPCAVRSVLEQTCAEFELIVCDNHCSDGTAEVVRGFTDPRVRYIRTERVLPMPENWAFALRQAVGEYVLFLPDDDALAPDALERGLAALRQSSSGLVCWKYVTYNDPHLPARPMLQNSLVFSKLNGQVTELDSRRTIVDLLSGTFLYPFPQLSNSLCRRALYLRALDWMPNALSAAGGDFTTAILLLAQLECYTFLSLPLTIIRYWEESLSSRVHRKEGRRDVRQFFTAGPEAEALVHPMPLEQLFLFTNLLYANRLAARRAIGGEIAAIPWDPFHYFCACHREITQKFEEAEKGAALAVFRDVLDRQEPALRDRVWQALQQEQPRGWLAHGRRWLREFIDNSPALARFEVRLRPQLKGIRLRLVRGQRQGFRNLSEAAQRLPGLTQDLLSGRLDRSCEFPGIFPY